MLLFSMEIVTLTKLTFLICTKYPLEAMEAADALLEVILSYCVFASFAVGIQIPKILLMYRL